MTLMARYLIPLPGGGDVTLEGPFPLGEHGWSYLMTVLATMKPGLVTMPDEASAVLSADDTEAG